MSFIFVPIIRKYFGFGASFLVPTIFIIFAIFVFLSRRKEYRLNVPGTGTSLTSTFLVAIHLVGESISDATKDFGSKRPTSPPPGQLPTTANNQQQTMTNSAEISSLDEFDSHKHSTTRKVLCWQMDDDTPELFDDARQALRVVPIMALLPMFWMLYDQQGSVWTLQATRMELHGLQPEQLQIVNPAEIMLFIPMFDRIIYPAMDKRNWSPTHLQRMQCGMVLVALAFVVSGALESLINIREENGEPKIHILWQLPQITILSLAEILVSVTGLEFAYASAPTNMKSFIMAMYLLTTAVGDLFGGILYSSVFQLMNRDLAMYVCAALMVLNWAIFSRVAVWWEKNDAPNPVQEKPSSYQSTGLMIKRSKAT